MSDPLRRVEPHEDLEMLLRADTFNLHQEAARDYLNRKLGKSGSSGNPRRAHPFNTAWFKFDENSLGLEPFSVVAIGDQVGAVTDELKLTTLEEPIFVAETPATADDQFAILVNGIPAGDARLGLGAVAGVVLCKVNVTDAAHTRAKPTPGQTGYLTSAASGGVPVLWKEAGTGELWAMVRIDEGGSGEEDPSTPGSSPTCTGSKWWRQLRSDSGVAFVLSVTAKGAGACNCADDAYSSTADFDTDSWDAADQITICTVAYDVEITKPNGVPTLTLTPSGGGTAVTVPAECYGDGWAQFTFPGDVTNEGICTDPVAEGCDGDNGFTIRVICACVAENYDGPGWYILAEDYNVGGIDRSAGDAIELTSGAISVSGVDCPVLCPGGPHADQATAEANSCFLESPCYSGFLIPTALEVEYYDGTGDLACYNGTVHDIDWSPGNGVWCDVVSGYVTEDVPCGFDGWRNIFQCGGGAFILTSNSDPPGAGSPVDPSKTGASVSGTGPTFEAVFTGMTDISFPNATGTLSAVVRARAA